MHGLVVEKYCTLYSTTVEFRLVEINIQAWAHIRPFCFTCLLQRRCDTNVERDKKLRMIESVEAYFRHSLCMRSTSRTLLHSADLDISEEKLENLNVEKRIVWIRSR